MFFLGFRVFPSRGILCALVILRVLFITAARASSRGLSVHYHDYLFRFAHERRNSNRPLYVYETVDEVAAFRLGNRSIGIRTPLGIKNYADDHSVTVTFRHTEKRRGWQGSTDRDIYRHVPDDRSVTVISGIRGRR